MATSSSTTNQSTKGGSSTTNNSTSNTVSQNASTSQTAGTSQTTGGSTSTTNTSSQGGSHTNTSTQGGSSSDTSTKGGSTSQTSGKSWASGTVDSDVQAAKKYYESGYQQSQQVQDTYNRLQNTLNNKPGAFSSAYTDKLNNLYDQLMNRDKFSYNFNADPMYQMYREQYTQQGKSAMQDTMGQAAALTGGYASSYSQTAGQQTYQNYLQQLNDIIPELRNQAYQEWQAEGEDLKDKYNLTQTAYNNEYNQYRDTVSDWQQDRSFDLSNYQSDRDFDYSKFTGDRSYYQNEYWNQRNAEQSNSSNTDTSSWSKSHTDESNWSNSVSDSTNWSNSTSTTNSTNWSNTANNSVTATNGVTNSTTNQNSQQDTTSWSNTTSNTSGYSSGSGSSGSSKSSSSKSSGSSGSSSGSSTDWSHYDPTLNFVTYDKEINRTGSMSEKAFEENVVKNLESGNYSVDDARRIMMNYDMKNGTNYLGGTPILSKSNTNWNGSSPSNVSWSSSKNKNKK